jgi:arsenical pump membrane protein
VTASPELARVLLWTIVAISIVLMLIRPRDIAEVYWVSGGALLLVALRLIPLGLALRAIGEGYDVYLFLIGMMLVSELARDQGVFDWLACHTVQSARGSATRLFTLVYAAGTVVTIFMSNDATAVVLTPAILGAVRQAKAKPLPYVFACALIANAASFVLPISNPANLVVFRSGMPPLGQWLKSFGLPALLSIIATYLVMRVLYRRELKESIETDVRSQPLRPGGKLVLGGLGAMSLVLLVSSARHWDLGLPTCLTALAITLAVSLRARSNPLRLVREISWGTLGLVAALFILVDAASSQGALRFTVGAFGRLQQLAPAAGALIAGSTVGVANNLVNNLPLGLLAGSTLDAVHAHGLIANAVLIGVDLGPNLCITGSLATILWLIALRKGGIRISFREFLRVGRWAMPIALLSALLGAWLTR